MSNIPAATAAWWSTPRRQIYLFLNVIFNLYTQLLETIQAFLYS
jgi:hypothetical protein